MSLKTIANSLYTGYEIIKKFIDFCRPYQPYISAGSILGKASWRAYKAKPLKNKIRILTNEIERRGMRIEAIQKHMPERAVALQEEINSLELVRRENVRELGEAALSLSQLPSLFFDHPGDNIYNNTYQIVAQSVQIHHAARPLEQTDRAERRLKTLTKLVYLAGLLSMMAQRVELVEKEEPVSLTLIRTMIAIDLISMMSLIMTTCRSMFEHRPQ